MHLKYDIICALACLAMERVGMLMLLVSVVQSAVDSLNDKQRRGHVFTSTALQSTTWSLVCFKASGSNKMLVYNAGMQTMACTASLQLECRTEYDENAGISECGAPKALVDVTTFPQSPNCAT